MSVAVTEAVRRFWVEPSSPVNAAVLRIVVFFMLFRPALAQNPAWYADAPETLRELPPGWGVFGSLPFDERVAALARDALVVSSMTAILGIFTRASAPIAALLAVYVFGIPQFFAKINHGHHGLVLCALTLAASPCGDALSLDRLWKRLRGFAPPTPSAAYTVPVRFLWLLIGTTYFFPGFWKLWEGGRLWFTGQALKSHLYRQWGSFPDFEPLFRIDRYGWLLALLGTATIVFELGFVFAMANRAWRTVAGFSAVAFHLGIGAFLGIWFGAFFPLLVLLEIPERWPALRRYVPAAWRDVVSVRRARVNSWLDRLRSRFRASPELRSWPRRSAWVAAVVGGVLLAGQIVTGFGNINTWPVSVYPTFAIREAKLRKRGAQIRVLLESEGKEPVDLGRKLRRMGPARLRKLLIGIEARMEDGAEMPVGESGQYGATIVSLFRHAGARVEPGDRIAIVEASWNVIPPGKRKGHREEVKRRYLVTQNDSLVVER